MTVEAVGWQAPAGAIPRAESRAWTLPLLGLLLFAALLVLRALDTPVDHDEDQYIAGAVLAADRLIFRDFLHLQTPLQALLFAPLAELFPARPLAVMRVANAVIGALTALALFGAMRTVGASLRTAAVATMMFALCQPYQMAASVVRNDMVPSLFSALGILAALAATRRPSPQLWWALSGLAFGLATSAKISHAFLAAGAGLFVLGASWRGRTWGDFLAYAAGGFAGLVPTLVVLAAAPEATVWGIVGFAAAAPFDWYRLNGLEHMLTLGGKLKASVGFLARSFVLPALALVAVSMLWRRARAGRARREAVLLDTLVIAGLIASLLPTPTWQWYFLPLLLPLFVRVALIIAPWVDRWPRVAAGAAAAMLGLFVAQQALTIDLGRGRVALNAADGLKLDAVEAEAHWIGERLRAAGTVGSLATLSPHAVLGSGYPLDPRFATGVFVYRSGNLLRPEQHTRLRTLGPQVLAAELDRSPPAAIVVGYERGSALFRVRPDDSLRDYAVARGYRLERSPVRRAELFINPRAPCLEDFDDGHRRCPRHPDAASRGREAAPRRGDHPLLQ